MSESAAQTLSFEALIVTVPEIVVLAMPVLAGEARRIYETCDAFNSDGRNVLERKCTPIINVAAAAKA